MQENWNDIWLELNECIINEKPEKDYHKMVEVCISYMGWSRSKKEIIHKKRFHSGHSYVEADILVQREDIAQWVVEVKEPTHKQIKEDLTQLFSYMRLAKLPVGVYIGEHIELFYDKEGCNEPISVQKFKIEKDSIDGVRFVDLFCKQNYSIENAVTFCEEKILEKQKKETLSQIKEHLKGLDGSAFIVNLFKDSLLKDTKMQFTKEELDEIFEGLTLKIIDKVSEEELSCASFVQDTHEEVVTTAGVPIPIPLGDEHPYVFTLTQKKLEAVATLHFYRTSKRFILKAGSQIKALHDSSCPLKFITLRKTLFSDPELCNLGEEVVTLLKDLEVPELGSPSALAVFCCGGSRNGTKSWVDSNSEYYDKKWWAGEDEPQSIKIKPTTDKQQIG